MFDRLVLRPDCLRVELRKALIPHIECVDDDRFIGQPASVDKRIGKRDRIGKLASRERLNVEDVHLHGPWVWSAVHSWFSAQVRLRLIHSSRKKKQTCQSLATLRRWKKEDKMTLVISP